MGQPEMPIAQWGAQFAWGTARLKEAGIPTPKLDASVLLAHLLQVPRTLLVGFSEREMTAEQVAAYAEIIAQRSAGQPVAYLTGHKEFMGLDLQVNQHVLVPRPETELVVEAALSHINQRLGTLADDEDNTERPSAPIVDFLVADIGTGSGAIAIALATLEPRIGRIYASDISADALAVAQHNSDRHHVSDRISWLQGDLLSPIPVPVDMIVANLPYVRNMPSEVDPHVAAYEPHIALFGGDDDGLGVIRQLLATVSAKLRPQGSIILEFGYDQRDALAAIFATTLPAATLTFFQDFANWDRYVVARLP